MKKIILSLSILLIGISASPLCCAVSAASIRYLVQTGATGQPTWRAPGNGEILVDLTSSGQSFNSWYNATVAATDEVWVINGTFVLTGAITVNSTKVSHSVYGGFLGTETSVNDRSKVNGGKVYEFLHPTILDGNMTSGIISQTSASTIDVLFDGFTISNGFNSGNGGGVFIRDGFTLQNCIVSNNTATTGGGVYLYNGGKLINSLVENNKANQAGGVYATSGVESVKPSVINCLIQYNQAYTDGGGLRIQATIGLPPEIKNTVICGNIAMDANNVLKYGSGVHVNMGNPVFSNCIIANNTGVASVNLYGGDLQNTTIVNNVGIPVYINVIANSSCKLTNCIVWGNLKEGSPSTPVDGNITLQNNTKVDIINCGVFPAIRTDALYTQTNNFLFESENDSQAGNKGPGFVKSTTFVGAPADVNQKNELEASNWDIKSTSGAIDRGVSIASVATDISGRTRPYGAAYDIGAYEFDLNTGVDIINEFGYNYFSKNKMIFIEGLTTGEIVDIFTVGGVLVKNLKSMGSGVSIEMPYTGIFILKIADKAVKLIVK